jgi:TrmH family RNA methyltransferase
MGNMGRSVITSLSNPLVKQARALRQRKARTATGLFLVEGIHHVGEVVAAGWEVDTLLYAPDLLSSDFAAALLEQANSKGILCQPVSAKVMDSLAGKEHPQGILALVRQRDQTLADLSPDQFRRGVAVVSPQDPGNVGTILRTIDAVGADGLIILDGGVDLYHPSCVRASMGTLFWKPVVRTGFDAFLTWSRSKGYHLLGSSTHASLDYRNFDPDNSPWILLLGSEQKGLSMEQIEACDQTVSLPMHGRASSLNLAVAAGILLYALGEKY